MASSKKELEEKLRDAAGVGNVEKIVSLLDLGADIAAPNLDGWTALMMASKAGHMECVKVLLDKGAEINIQDKVGWTTLMKASKAGHMECLQVLLDKGANVNMPNKDGWTALMMASEAGHMECVKVLLDKGADVNMPNKDGWTALLRASGAGHMECVKVLLDNGAEVNIQDKNGWTALKKASVAGHIQCVEVLLDKGAEINIQDKDRWTALMSASLAGHMECVKVLLDKGAEANIQDTDGWTALMRASREGYMECVKVLLDKGADVNIQDKMDVADKCLWSRVRAIPNRSYLAADEGDSRLVGHGHKSINAKDRVTIVLCVNATALQGTVALIVDGFSGRDNSCNDPLGQGVIAALKVGYMSRLVGKLVEIADRYDELQVLAKQLPAGHAGLQYGCQPHVRDAIMLLKEAWDSISPSTIAACWRCLSVTESARVASDCRSYNSKREPMTIEAMCNKLSSLTLCSPSVVKLLDAMDLAVLANAAQKVLDKAATMLSEWLHLEEMGFIDVNDEGDDSDDSDECQDAVDKDRWTALMLASMEGHMECVKVLLDNGAEINIQDKEGWTTLMKSSRAGHMECVTVLLDKGAEVNIQDTEGWTALMLASRAGHMECVTVLLDKGAEVNIPDTDGWTALLRASGAGHMECVKVLLDNGAEVNIQDKNGWTALKKASVAGHIQCVEVLLDKGAEINIQDKDRWTALMSASLAGHMECVKVLLDKGAEANIQNTDGWTALMLASKVGNMRCVKVLLDKGAEFNIQDKDGWSTLMIASKAGNMECVKVLLDKGAEVNIQDTDGWTALMLASQVGHMECVKVLLDKAAEVNIQDKDGWTAVMRASRAGHMECVKVLLDMGAEVNIQDKDGWTALIRASREGYMECVKVLLDKGAEITIQNKDGWTALMSASLAGHMECVKVLLDKGAEVNIQDMAGWTTLMIASKAGHMECVKVLLDKGAEVNMQTWSGDTALHLAVRATEVEEKDKISCVRTLLFHPGIDVNLKNFEGRTTMRDAGYGSLSVFNQVLKTCNDFPADSYGKVVLCGNSGAGKSTLAQRVFGWEGVVEPLTAGIIPHQVDSPYSNMIIYDLAGHHQYFSSHSACLEAISLNSPAIFLLLQDLTKDFETMAKEERLPLDMRAILLSDLLIRLDTDQDKFINPDITAVVPLLNTLSEKGQEVDLSKIKTNMAHEGLTNSDLGPLLFIPALVSIDRPSSATVPNNSFCWSEIVKSTDEFFTPRFHHVLLHRLPLEFALPEAQTTSLLSQPLNRLCDVWSGGIKWLSETGVTTVVEMSESFQAISLTMSSPNKASPKYLELAHSVREVIKKARQELCPYLEVLEVVSCPPECSSDHSIDTRVELSRLRKAILKTETHIVDVSGKKSVAIDEWKKMEPHLSSLVEACTLTGQVLPPVEDTNVNVIQQIGVNYSKFGILLLNDNNGTIVKALEKQYCQNAEDIIIAIFGKWLEGMGEKPVAWSTLVATLQKINM
eukprot:Em0002g1806a